VFLRNDFIKILNKKRLIKKRLVKITGRRQKGENIWKYSLKTYRIN